MNGSIFWSITWRLIALIGLTVVAVLSVVAGQWLLLGVVGATGIAVVVSVGVLYANQLRKNAFLFEAIENEDFAFRFNEDRGSKLERRHHRSLNRMRRVMESIHQKSRERNSYYEKILDRSSSGVLVIDPMTGVVFQTNRAACELLGVTPLTHIEQLQVVAGDLPNVLRSIEAGRNQTVGYYTERQRVELTLSASWVELHDKRLKIVALSDIGSSIDQAQIQSWTQLSRVLAHEIMNSLAPITSLSEQLLQTNDPTQVRRGLEVIQTTSRGLVGFVENYRQLTRIPTPVVRKIELLPWLERTARLFDRPIEVRCPDPTAVLYADPDLLTQVVANLLKNAIEAAIDSAIWIEVRSEGSQTLIEVGNTGPEIDPQVRQQMFVPFFTTKSDGSGIGLSLSRQVMRLHNGTLTHTTRALARGTKATLFTLTF